MTLQPVWRWRAFGSRFLVALAIVSVATASSLGYAYWFANDQINRAPVTPIPKGVLAPGKSTDPANYLIVGSDSRAFVEGAVAADHFGTAKSQPGNRADVIMIAHVDPKAPGEGFLVSIPRDTWVSIPGHGHQKINAALNYGNGPATLIETIHNNFGIAINHYLKLDFVAFTDIVNAIGHVNIFFPAPAFDVETGLYVKTAGCVPLDGLQALAYARSRFYRYRTAGQSDDPKKWTLDQRYDLGRIQRQQYFIRSLAQQAIKDGARNPLKARAILEKIVPHLERSPEVGLSQFLALVRAFRSVNPGDVKMLTVPTKGEILHPGGDVEIVQTAQAQPIFSLLGSFTKTAAKPKHIAPKTIAVQVLNGSGVKGVAGNTEAALHAAGFANGGAPTDADRHDYQYTEVRYSAGNEAKARVVASYLGGVGLLTQSTTPLGSADVVVVTGQDLVTVGAPGSHTHTTSTATTAPPNLGSTPGVTVPQADAGRPQVGCG